MAPSARRTLPFGVVGRQRRPRRFGRSAHRSELIWRTKAPWLADLRPLGRDRQRQKSRHPQSMPTQNRLRLDQRHDCRPVDVTSRPMIHRWVGDPRTRLPRRRHVAATSCCRQISFSATRAARERSISNTNRHKAPSIPTRLSGEAPRLGGLFSQPS